MKNTSEVRSPADLGRVVRTLRLRSGMTQEQLAQVAGISREYIAKIESGRSSSVLEHELRILRRMGAKLTVTFNDAETPGGASDA